MISFLILLKGNLKIQAQKISCGFDEIFEENLNNGTLFYDNFEQNEESILDMLNDTVAMALIEGNATYTIPVVVHIMHTGDLEGIDSNISDSQVDQALSDLNSIFSNSNNAGVDIGIQFCLAERNPISQITDGMNRFNAASICVGPCYGSSGITIGGAQAMAVQSLSRWPNSDYINIWVVHKIIGANGYAYSPGSNQEVDGIVIDKDFFGVNGSKVLAHEMGHFFNLFHTLREIALRE